MPEGDGVQQVVTGVVFDSFVILPLALAKHTAAIIGALEASLTWGELRATLGSIDPGFLSNLLDPDEPPEDEDELPQELLNAELWPPPAMGITYDCLPRDLARRFGQVEANPSGWWLRIDPSHAQSMTSELRARGWTVTSDQKLIEHFQLE